MVNSMSLANGKSKPLTVNVFVVVNTDNKITDAMIKRDLNRANTIWKPRGISFRLKTITRHTDLSYKFKEREFVSGIFLNKQTNKAKKLISYNPAGSGRNDVVVIYLSAKSFKDVQAKRITTGAIYFFGKKSGPRTATIVLASESSGRAQMLAHELGHALFVDPITGRAINPSATMDPKETSHDLDKKNLMYPKPPLRPLINHDQLEKAKGSPLVR